VKSVLVDEDGALWLGTDKGLAYLSPIAMMETKPHAVVLSKESVRKVVIHRGDKWFVSISQGKYKLNKITGGRYISQFWLDIPIQYSITDLLIDKNEIWVSTERGGIWIFDLERLDKKQTYTSKGSGLSSNNVYQLERDHIGRIWAATETGLCRFDQSKWSQVFENEIPQVTAMKIAGRDIWVAGKQKIWKIAQGKTVKPIFIDYRLTDNRIECLAIDRKQNLWVGSNILGKYDPETDQWSVYDRNHGFFSQQALCLAVGWDNTMWIGTEGWGVFKVEDALMDVYIAELFSDDEKEEEAIAIETNAPSGKYRSEEEESKELEEEVEIVSKTPGVALNAKPPVSDLEKSNEVTRKNAAEVVELISSDESNFSSFKGGNDVVENQKEIKNSLSWNGKLVYEGGWIMDIFFDFNSLKITDKPHALGLLDFLRQNPNVSVSLIGHTAYKEQRTAAQLKKLENASKKRALAVLKFLEENGISSRRIFTVKGVGQKLPRNTIQTFESQSRNTRVEVILHQIVVE